MALGGGSVEGLQVPITGDSSELNSALDGAVGKLGDFRTAVGLAGAALAGMAAKGLASAVSSAADFEQAMANVEKVTDPTTAAEMRSELMRMAETIPLSTDRLAALASQAGRMGAEGTDEVAAFTEVAAEMGAATVLSAEDAGTALGKLSTALGEPLGEVGKLGDAINEVSNNFATDSTEIVDAAQRSGQVLTNLGLKSDEILGLSGAMNELSPTSRLAAERMEQMGEAMMDPGAVETFAGALGVTTDEFKNMREENPQETMLQLLEAVDSGEVSFQDLSGVMTKTAARAFRDTAGDVDLMRDALETSNSAMEEGGSLAKEVAVETDTAQGQFQLLKNRLNNVAIEIGDNLLPYIRDFLAEITKLVDRFSAVNSATDGWAGTLALLGGLVTGLVTAGGALISMMGGMSAVTGALTAGFSGLATAVGAVTAPILALAAVIAGVAAAWITDFAGIRTATMRIVGVLQEELQPAIDWLQTNGVPMAMAIKDAFLDFAQSVEPYIRPLVSIITDGLIAGIRLLFDVLGAVIPPTIEFFRRVGEQGSEFIGIVADAFEDVKTAVETVIARVREVLSPFLDWLSERFSSTDTDVIQPFKDAWTAIQEAIVAFDTKAREILGPLFTWLGERWTEVNEQVIQPWAEAFGHIADKIVEAVGRIREILNPFFTWLDEKVMVLVDSLLLYFEGLKEDLTVVWNTMIDVLQTAWDLFGDELLTLIEFYIDLIKGVWSTFWEGLLTTLETFALILQGDWEEAWNTVKTFLEDTLNGIIEFATEWGGRFLEWLGGLIDDVIQWFKDLASDLIGSSIIPEMFADILSAARGFGEDLLAWLGDTISTFISDVTQFASDVLQAYIDLWADLISEATGFGEDLLSWLSGMISDFIADVVDFAADVVSEFKSMGEDAIDAFTSIDFLGAGKDAVGDLVSGIRDKIPSVKSAAGAVADAYDRYMPGSDADEGPLSNLTDYGPAVVETFAKGIQDNVRAVERAARNVAATAEKVANPTVSPTGGHAVPMKVTADAVEKVSKAAKPVSDAAEKAADAVDQAANKASEDATDAVANAVSDAMADGAIRDPLSSKLDANRALESVARSAASGGDTVDEGDVNISNDITIEGDADRHDVERGLSRALQSYNLDR